MALPPDTTIHYSEKARFQKANSQQRGITLTLTRAFERRRMIMAREFCQNNYDKNPVAVTIYL